MASWQHAFRLSNESASGASREAVQDFERALADILPRTASWSKSIRQFGDIESTVCELSDDDDGTDVFLRIDTRTQWRDIVARLWEAGRSFVWREAPRGKVCRSLEEVEHVIQTGRAALFASDPHRFLDTVEELPDEDQLP